MRTAYRVIAHIIAISVVVQAAAIAFAIFGLVHWIDEGNVLDKATAESQTVDFQGVLGFMVHGMAGMMLIPLLGVILLVVSFFAKVPGGVALAGGILGVIIVQVLFGMMAHDMPWLGALHGLNAFVLLALAILAGMRARKAASVEEPAELAPVVG